jgi:hypothetical protein
MCKGVPNDCRTRVSSFSDTYSLHLFQLSQNAAYHHLQPSSYSYCHLRILQSTIHEGGHSEHPGHGAKMVTHLVKLLAYQDLTHLNTIKKYLSKRTYTLLD